MNVRAIRGLLVIALGLAVAVPGGAAGASADTIFVSNNQNFYIAKYASSGAASPFVNGGLNGPVGLALDRDGNLYVGNAWGNTIAKVTPDGVITTFAETGLNRPYGLAFDKAGNLYAANSGDKTIVRFTPAGVASVFVTETDEPGELAFDKAGNLYVSYQYTNTIKKFTPAGVGSTFISSGLSGPRGLTFDKAGNLYVSNWDTNTIKKFSAAGQDHGVFASTGLKNPSGLAFDSTGNLYAVNWGDSTVQKFSRGGTGTLFARDLSYPIDIAIETTAPVVVNKHVFVEGIHHVVLDDQPTHLAPLMVESPAPAKVPDVVLTRAETVATVTKNVVDCQMTLNLTSRSDEMQPVFTLPASIAVTGVEVRKGNRDGIQLVRRAQGYTLYSLRKGDYELTINFAVAAAGEDLKRQMVLPMPQATTAVLMAILPGASLDVTLSPDVPFKADDSKGSSTTVTVYGGPTEALTVTWSPKAPEKNLEARVFAENNSVVHFGQGVLRHESRITYSIIQGKVSTFRVRLPELGTLLKVEGENIRDWEIETADQKRVLRVDLLGPVAEKYVLNLAMEQAIESPVAGKPLALDLPLPEAVGASRETGSVAVVADKGLKAEAGQLSGVSQIDVRDMPQVAATRTNEEMHLGFKYVKRPIKIAVRLGVVEPQVSGEVFTLAKVAPESIRMTSVIKYQIRDSGVFRFRVRLDKDVRLIAPQGSDINNWSLTDQVLNVDLRSKAENEYTLTLITEKAIQGSDVQVPGLELVDVQRERGFVALEPAPGARIDPKSAEGITQINVKDLPPDVKELQNAVLAYRYIRHPYQLGVAISEVQPEIVAATQTLVDIDETDLKVAFDVVYDIRKAGVFSLRLAVPAGLQILSLSGAQVEDWKQAKDTGLVEVTLKSRTDGVCALHLTGEKRLARDASKPVELPRIALEGVRRDTGFLAVRPADGLRVRSDEKILANFSEIDVKELPATLQASGVTLAFKYFLPTWQAALQVEKIDPYVTAEVFNFISLGEAYIQASAAIKYSIQYAGVQTFRFKLPADAVNIDITAPNIKSKEQQVDPKDKGLIWTVTFQAKCKDALKIVMSYQTKVEKDVKELDYVGVQALDVSQEHGFLAVAPRSDLEVSATDKTLGMIAIDDHEIPVEYMRGIPAVALAYRYPKPPYNLHLSMIHRQPADVLVAVIDSCRLTTLVTDDGNLMTDAVYLMRNVRKQYLELRLPAGAQIWHAYVGAEQVTPVTSEQNGQTVTMIPITGRGKGQQQFEIRLRYSSRSHNLGEIGRLALQVPGTEVAAIRVGWEIDIPQDYVVLSSGGTMNRVETLDPALISISMVPPDPARIYSEAAANLPADQSTMQEEMNRRVNDYNATVTVQSLAPAPKTSVYAQDKSPVKRVYFQSMVAMGDPPSLRLSYLRAPWVAVMRGLLVILVALCGFGFWIRSRGSITWKFAALISAVALLLAWRTIAGYSFGIFLTDMLETLAAIVVLMAVVRAGGAICRGVNARRNRTCRSAADDIHMVSPVLHPAPAGDSPGSGSSTQTGGSSETSAEDL